MENSTKKRTKSRLIEQSCLLSALCNFAFGVGIVGDCGLYVLYTAPSCYTDRISCCIEFNLGNRQFRNGGFGTAEKELIIEKTKF